MSTRKYAVDKMNIFEFHVKPLDHTSCSAAFSDKKISLSRIGLWKYAKGAHQRALALGN